MGGRKGAGGILIQINGMGLMFWWMEYKSLCRWVGFTKAARRSQNDRCDLFDLVRSMARGISARWQWPHGELSGRISSKFLFSFTQAHVSLVSFQQLAVRTVCSDVDEG
jgi:hypothetical protein